MTFELFLTITSMLLSLWACRLSWRTSNELIEMMHEQNEKALKDIDHE